MTVQTRSAQPAKRIGWVDYAKGIGIFLVVLGHVLRGLLPAILSPSPLTQAIDQWIYTFHMPLFFFLSGLFIVRSAAKPLPTLVQDKLQTIAYPYFVWSLLQELLRIGSGQVDGDRVTALTQLWQILYQPVMQFWFLYVLLLMSLGFGVAYKLNVKPLGFLGIAVALLITHFVGLNIGPWGVLYQLRWHLIYFAVGAVLGSRQVLSQLYAVKPTGLALAAIGGFGAIGVAVSLGWLELAGKLEPSLSVLGFSFVGIAAVIALSAALERWETAKFVQQWGQLSLQIFVAHTIAAACFRIILQKLFKVNDPAIHLILGTAVGLYVPIGLSWLAQKFNVPQLFTLRSNQQKPA